MTSVLFSLPLNAWSEKHKWKHDDVSPESVAEASAAIKLNPRDAEAYLRRAEARGDEKRTLQLSLDDVNKAIALSDDHARYYLTKASILDQMEEDEEALEAIRTACKLDPHYGNAWHMRSVICYHLKLNDEALKSAEESIRLVPNNAGYMQCKARALRAQSKWKECLQVLDQALKIEPKHIPIIKDRVEANTRLKKWNNVVSDANYILTLEKSKTSRRDVLQSRATAHSELKEYPKAVDDLKTALKLFPDDRQSHVLLLETYKRMGDSQNADRESKFIQGVDKDMRPME